MRKWKCNLQRIIVLPPTVCENQCPGNDGHQAGLVQSGRIS